MIQIRPLGSVDADAYWSLRLAALGDEPLAFGSSIAEHRTDGFETVTERHLRNVPDGNFMLGAFESGALVGIVGLVRSDREKRRHLAEVIAMFVTPGWRGRGVASRLLAALLERARSYESLEGITLSVAVQAVAARALYRSFGFVPYGVEPHALKVDGAYADLELMSLVLR